jgi:hypothetical protein
LGVFLSLLAFVLLNIYQSNWEKSL